jgi:hypothetical protein
LVCLVGFLALVATLHRAEDDLQHLAAAICGVGLLTVYNRRTVRS